MKYELRIGWLYPELMSTYGDRGNITVLTKRCEWRGVEATLIPVTFTTTNHELLTLNLLFGGGAQDRQQSIVIDDLRKNKGPVINSMINNGIPGLFVCGSPQLLGEYYMTGDGQKLEGLGIFDMVSKHFGKDKPRCIGNTVCVLGSWFVDQDSCKKKTIVGFENHGGRTYLGEKVKPLAQVLVGYGNNGEDNTEGAIFNNCIATYSHGPFLPKNPHLADWLIAKALEIKYRKMISLDQLNDQLEWQAHNYILQKYGVNLNS
jgi:lipid II isoglutaminyl synthase (glutamine-hydrolysing)